MGEAKADSRLKVLALLTEGQRKSGSDGDSLILQKIVHNLHNLHRSSIFIAQCAVWVFIVWAKTCIEERFCHIVKVDSVGQRRSDRRARRRVVWSISNPLPAAPSLRV
jgi:hypothetical protein